MLRANSALRRSLGCLGAAAVVAALAGCESVALTAFGVGASTGVAHTLNGYAYRTFTVPEGRVKGATLTALQRMDIKVANSRKVDGVETIQAKARGRDIEVALEPLSANTTRMRAVARDGLLNDSATAIEIISQTERVLGNT